MEITLNNILSKNDNEILSPGNTDALNTLKNEVVFGAEKEVEKEVEGRRRMSWPFGMFFAPVLLDGTLACDAGKYVFVVCTFSMKYRFLLHILTITIL